MSSSKALLPLPGSSITFGPMPGEDFFSYQDEFLLGFGSEEDVKEDREWVRREKERDERRRANKRRKKANKEGGKGDEGTEGKKREMGEKGVREVGESEGRMEVGGEGGLGGAEEERSSSSLSVLSPPLPPPQHHQQQDDRAEPSTNSTTQAQGHPRTAKTEEDHVQLQSPPSPPPPPPPRVVEPESQVVPAKRKIHVVEEPQQQPQDHPSFIENSVYNDVDLMDDVQPLPLDPPSLPLPNHSQPPNSTQPAPHSPSHPHRSNSTPQPLTRTHPPINLLPRHLSDSHAHSTPHSSSNLSLSNLTNVTTPGDSPSFPDSSFLATGPSSKQKKPYVPPHIQKMLDRKLQIAALDAEVEVEVVVLEGKGKGKGKEKGAAKGKEKRYELTTLSDRFNQGVRRAQAQALAQGGAGLDGGKKGGMFEGLMFWVVFSKGVGNLVMEGHRRWLEKASSYGALISPALVSGVTHVISHFDLKAAGVLGSLKCSSWEDLDSSKLAKFRDDDDDEKKTTTPPLFVSSRWFEACEIAGQRVSEQEFLIFFQQLEHRTTRGGGGGGGKKEVVDLTKSDSSQPDDDHNLHAADPSLNPAPAPPQHSLMQEKNKRTYTTSTDTFHVHGFQPQPSFALNPPSGGSITTTSALRDMSAMKRGPPPPPTMTTNAVAGPSRTSWSDDEEDEEAVVADQKEKKEEKKGGLVAPSSSSSVSVDGGDGAVGESESTGKVKDELSDMIEAMKKGEVDDRHLSRREGEEDSEDEEEDLSVDEKERRLSLLSSSVSVQTSSSRHPTRIPSFEEPDMDTDEEKEMELNRSKLGSARAAARAEKEAAGGVFQCQRSSRGHREGPNEYIAKAFEELDALYSAQTRSGGKDSFRFRSYSQVAGILRNHPVTITSYHQAREIDKIGHSQAFKIHEIIQTGSCTRLKLEMLNPKVLAARDFSGIYGIGTKRGNQLYDQGARKLDDLRRDPDKYNLTLANRIGLEYYDDLKIRIPRDEVTELFNVVNSVVQAIDPLVQCQAMGSYRRGAEDCGDIDILISRDTSDGRDHSGVLDRALKALRQSGFLVHDLANPKDDATDLEAKYMGICRLSPHHIVRRIDILTIPFHELGAALIYFTGNDIFNRSMRLLANKKGFSLNQRALSKDVARDRATRLKITAGSVIASRTEEEIFAALGVTWRPPNERIC